MNDSLAYEKATLTGVPAVLEQKTSIRWKYLCYKSRHGTRATLCDQTMATRSLSASQVALVIF